MRGEFLLTYEVEDEDEVELELEEKDMELSEVRGADEGRGVLAEGRARERFNGRAPGPNTFPRSKLR
jgi:hypothetical protein